MIVGSASPALCQPKISAISFRGNHFFSERNLRGFISLSAGNDYSAERAKLSNEAICDRYRSEGFFSIGLDSVQRLFSSDSDFVELVYYVSEGTQSVVGEFRITGAKLFSRDDIRRQCETVPGAPLRQEVLEQDIDNLLTRYDNKGHPLAKVRIDSICVDTSSGGNISFVMTIAEGPQVRTREVKVEGNTATHSEVVVREAYLRPDELYSQEKLDRIRRRLERLGIFSSVGEPQLYLTRDPETADTIIGGLLIAVQEGNTNTFDGIAGYVPPAANQSSGYFTGKVLVSMKNLFGTARRAVLHWQRENQSTQELEVSYDEPWVAGLPVSAGLSLYQRKQDSTYIKNRFGIRAEFSVSAELSLGLSVTQESVYPSADLNYFTVFESSVLALGGEIRYDTRNNPLSPTSGIAYATMYSRGTKRISGPQQYLYLADDRDYLVERLSVDMEYYLPTFPKQVMMAGFHGRKISSGRLEQSDLYQLGGTNTVRGYRENQFYGSQTVWLNLEYRFLTGRVSSIFLFADGGHFARPSDEARRILSQEKLLYGYGAGARIETSLGVVRVSYALGEGDGFSAGKIHFGIGNEF